MQRLDSRIYNDIYNTLINLIPEKWEKICLYATVIGGLKGEMYFYYFPKKLIKTKPVNCYEIANRFGLDENTYNEEISKLYTKVRNLKQLIRQNWTNVTISVDKKFFNAEYRFDNLINSRYSDEERHLIWCYRYLNTPIESLSKKDQNLILSYKENSNIKPIIFVEEITNLEKLEVKNPILKV